MSSAKKASRAAVGHFRTYTAPDGLLYGELRKGDDQTSELLLPDGNVLRLPEGARTQLAADPDVIPTIPFDGALPDEASAALKHLLERFQTEHTNAEDRRRWAESQLGNALAQGREADELIRFRYEEYRRALATRLSELLEAHASSGRSTLLNECLENDKPGDVRRVALLLAAKLGFRDATAGICAAAIHRTQLDLARVAIHALAQLAPERLPLVSANAQEGVATSESLEAARSLPEWQLVTDTLTSISTTLGEVDPERTAHLAAALDTPSAVAFWGRLANLSVELSGSVVRAVAGLLRPLAVKDSPTAYETALRIGLSRLALADDTDVVDADCRNAAARLLMRDLAPEAAAKVMLDLPDDGAQLMLSTSLSSPRARGTRTLLHEAAKGRPSIGASISAHLLQKVKQNELEGLAKVCALALLARSPEGREVARRTAASELGTAGDDADALLARALVEGDALPSIARLRAAARPAVLSALKFGTASLGAGVLEDLRAIASPESLAQDVPAVELPDDWTDESEALRNTLVAWLPQLLVADATESALFSSATRALAKDAPEKWSSWDEPVRRACLDAISRSKTSDAVTFFVRMIESRPVGSPDQYSLLHEFFARIVSRHPDVLDQATPSLPPEVALRQALRTASLLHHERSANEARRQLIVAGRVRTLGRALEESALSASAAVGTEESIGALMARLADDVRNELQSSDPTTNSQVADFLRLAETSDSATLTREALRCAGARGSGSPVTLAFFRERALLLLDALDLEGLRAFLSENQRFVERLGPMALELISEALILAGADPTEAVGYLSGPRSIQLAANVAIRTADRSPEAAYALLGLSGVSLRDMANALSELRRAADSLSAGEGGVGDPVTILARRIAPTLEALEQLILPVMRIRRILARSGLSPVESVLGEVREYEELSASRHKVMGMSADRGPHEVQTFGIKLDDSVDAIVPSIVARVIDQKGTDQG